jgi:hypothetical protein
VLTAPGEVIGIILSGVVPARTYSLTYDWVQAPEARVCALPDAVHRQQDVTLPPDDKLGFNLKRDGESTGGLPPRLR